LYVAQ
jgi:hypothetical protein